jgi:hypothetical protein
MYVPSIQPNYRGHGSDGYQFGGKRCESNMALRPTGVLLLHHEEGVAPSLPVLQNVDSMSSAY